MINILLVDDQILVREGIKKVLNAKNDIKIIGEVSNGEEALDFVRNQIPDVVLIELKISGIGGIESTRRMLKIGPDIKVIALTSCSGSVVPYHFLQVGGVGYVTKSAGVDELLTAIHKVKSNQIYITSDVAQEMAVHQTNQCSSPFEKLSSREMQIMWMVIRGSRVNEIAQKLFLSPKTVNTYRYRTFEKLNIRNNVQLMYLAFQYHLVDKDPVFSRG